MSTTKEYPDASVISKIFNAPISDCCVTVIRQGYFGNSYKLTDGRSVYFARTSPPDDYLCLFYEKQMMHQEPDLHSIILDKTDIPVPKVLFYDWSRRLIDKDIIVMEYLPGETLDKKSSSFSLNEYNNCLSQLGGYIRKLHAITGNKHGYIGPHKPMIPQDTWRKAFCIMWEKLVKDCRDCGGYSKEQAEFVLSVFQKLTDVIPDNISASLMHMDIWSTNILTDRKGNITGLIDFDRACWGDPELDLAIAQYCGLLKSSFCDGYGVNTNQVFESEIRQKLYMLYEHQKYIVICMSQRRNNPSGAKMYANQSLSILKRLSI